MPLDPALRDKILASIETGFTEQIAFTQQLIRFASVRGAEHACQDFVFRALKERGFVMDRFAMDRAAIKAHPGGAPFSDTHSNAPIVVGIHHPREEKGRSLILQASTLRATFKSLGPTPKPYLHAPMRLQPESRSKVL